MNPDQHHLDHHNMRFCQQSSNRFAFKRRGLIVDHLAKHHQVNSREQGQVIADRWKTDSDKQAWSCGFCVELFHSLEDRLNHIAMEYRDNGRVYDEWSLTNVIKGLLLQPHVATTWDNLIRTHYGSIPIQFVWHKNGNNLDDLRTMLERGPSQLHNAAVLAQAAMAAAEIDTDAPEPYHSAFNEAPNPYRMSTGFMASDASVRIPTPAIAETMDHFDSHSSMLEGQRHSPSTIFNPANDTSNDLSSKQQPPSATYDQGTYDTVQVNSRPRYYESN